MDFIKGAVNNEPVQIPSPRNQEHTAPQQFDDTVTVSKPVIRGVGSLAATGSTAADAAIVDDSYGVLQVTAADGTKGVILQTTPALAVGFEIRIHNVANAILKIYPPTGGNFNSGTTDAAISVTAKRPAVLVNLGSNLWTAQYT